VKICVTAGGNPVKGAETPKPAPGFEAVFAVSGIAAAAHYLRKNRS